MTKNIFNWNHVSEKLTDDQIYELRALYKFYHKKYWLFKMTYKYFKKAELACNIGSVFFVVTGTVVGGVTLMQGSILPVTIPPPRAHPLGFAIFFLLGGLFPTPGHAERDNSPPPGLVID